MSGQFLRLLPQRQVKFTKRNRLMRQSSLDSSDGIAVTSCRTICFGGHMSKLIYALVASALMLPAPAGAVRKETPIRTDPRLARSEGRQWSSCAGALQANTVSSSRATEDARARLRGAASALYAAVGSEDEVQRLIADRERAENALALTEYEKRQQGAANKRTMRALLSGRVGIALREAGRGREVTDRFRETPQRAEARSSLARIDARLAEMEQGRRGAASLLADYDRARSEYDLSLHTSLSRLGAGQSAVMQFMVIEQEVQGVGKCPASPVSGGTPTRQVLAQAARPLTASFATLIARAGSEARSADDYERTLTTYRRSAVLSDPAAPTGALIAGMNDKLASMRANEVRQAESAARAASSARLAALKAREARMAAAGPDAQAIAATLASAYFKAQPQIVRSTGMMSKEGAVVRTNMLVAGYTDEFKLSGTGRPACTKAGRATFRCTYKATFSRSADMLGANVGSGSSTFDRVDTFTLANGEWSSTSADQYASALVASMASSPSTSSSSDDRERERQSRIAQCNSDRGFAMMSQGINGATAAMNIVPCM